MKKKIAILLTLVVAFLLNARIVFAEEYVDEVKYASTNRSVVSGKDYTLEVGKEYKVINDGSVSNGYLADNYVSFVAPQLSANEELHLLFNYEKSCYAMVDVYNSDFKCIGQMLGDKGGTSYHYTVDVNLSGDLSEELVSGERYYLKINTYGTNTQTAYMELISYEGYPEKNLKCNETYEQKLLSSKEVYKFVAPATGQYDIDLTFTLRTGSGLLYFDFRSETEGSLVFPIDDMGYVSKGPISHTFDLKAGETYWLILGKPDTTYYGTAVYATNLSMSISTEMSLNPFTDVPANEYYTEPVLWAVEKGITSGLKPNQFAPDASCTRGQVVTFLWRSQGCPEPTSTSHNFTDLNANEYYYKAVLWAVENGITSGMTKTTFAPDATVTRGQFVTFLHRAEGKPAYTVSNPFTDLKSGEYYYDAVLWAVENKVTSGLKPTLFGPEEPCTRGQVVTFLYRAYNE